MTQFKDLAVEGAAIKAMPMEKRYFTIVVPEPVYIEIPSIEDPNKSKEKLIINVELSNGSKAEYYPNRTSSRKIANLAGTTDMGKWIGMSFFWGSILRQKVGSSGEKDVIYVTHKIKSEEEAKKIAAKLKEEA